MALSNIDDVFSGAFVQDGDVVIPSGSLISCDTPAANDPNEIIFGILETMHDAVSTEGQTYVRSSATSNLIDSSTYRRVYTFTVDLEFSNTTILNLLDVKPEPVE